MGDRTARGSRSRTEEREASRKPQKSEGGGQRSRAPQWGHLEERPLRAGGRSQYSPISVFKHWPDAVSQIRLQSKDKTVQKRVYYAQLVRSQLVIRYKFYNQHIPAFLSSDMLHSFTRSLNNLMF